jgi:hypothetical protein
LPIFDHVSDINKRDNVTGAGINLAQRVMDCGDAGHILVSKRFADDLAQHRRWQPYLHELGDVKVKHGVVVSLVNLYAETIGNPAPPACVAGIRRTAPWRDNAQRTFSGCARDLYHRSVPLHTCHCVSDVGAGDHALG